MSLPRVTEMAHDFVRRRLRPGEAAIDATAGNGHDTVFLAELVGPGGRVDAFDIQPEAISATRARVAAHPQVHLHLCGHECLAEAVPGTVAAAMFNLGYLPLGDKSIATRPENTLAALAAVGQLLVPGGILTAVVYPGHPGGSEEAAAVESWFSSLEAARFRAASYRPLQGDSARRPPFLLVAERRAG